MSRFENSGSPDNRKAFHNGTPKVRIVYDICEIDQETMPQDVDYSNFDIIGSTAEFRYPWQRDIGIQVTFVAPLHIPTPVKSGSPMVTLERASGSESSSPQALISPFSRSSDENETSHYRFTPPVLQRPINHSDFRPINQESSSPPVKAEIRESSVFVKPQPQVPRKNHGALQMLIEGTNRQMFGLPGAPAISSPLHGSASAPPPGSSTPPKSKRRKPRVRMKKMSSEPAIDPPSLQQKSRFLPRRSLQPAIAIDDSVSVVVDEEKSDSSISKGVALATDLTQEGIDNLLAEHFRSENGEATQQPLAGREDILPSPSISPLPWQKGNRDGVGTSIDDAGFLNVPQRDSYGAGGGASSDESCSESEMTPPSARRGRRAAISRGNQTVGDSSSDETDFGAEEDQLNTIESPERRRSGSLEIPSPAEIQRFQKRGVLKKPEKKMKAFSILKLIDKRSTRLKSTESLTDILMRLERPKFRETHLFKYRAYHWSELIPSSDRHQPLIITESERKRREAVWELFTSECNFLIGHLYVIKNCFMEPMKKMQVEGQLMFAEPQLLFGNIDEICYVSYTFCKELITAILKSISAENFGSTAMLLKTFKRLAIHSRNGEVYHDYCLNYNAALAHLDDLRTHDDFCEFEKWCESDTRCKRLQLTDLLVAPIQHATKMPLLLANISKYTSDPEKRNQIIVSLENVQNSLNNLESKMKWLKNFERVQALQQQIYWPSIFEIDPKAFAPEFIRMNLTRQPCERLLASPNRQLIHEGQLHLCEAAKSFEAYLFLFDDTLLVTKMKQRRRTVNKQFSVESSSSMMMGQTPRKTFHQESTRYVVHKQPIALDRLIIHDISQEAAHISGLKNAFVLVQISRFQQIIGVFTFQATHEEIKLDWLNHIRQVKKKYKAAATEKSNALKYNKRRFTITRLRSQSPRRHSEQTASEQERLECRPPSPRRHSAMPRLPSPELVVPPPVRIPRERTVRRRSAETHREIQLPVELHSPRRHSFQQQDKEYDVVEPPTLHVTDCS